MNHGAVDHAAPDHGAMDHAGMDDSMKAALGPYSMMREASGTSWQPDSSPMTGMTLDLGGWATMVHASVAGIYDAQGGPRGDSQFFSASMAMGMAQRAVGPGTLALRGMVSLDAFMGKRGYPLLLQSGETADGVDHLVDRQHPHDLLMELSASYALALDNERSVFAYVGYPGEPALGPPTFMHRFSGMANPAAPIAHHWLDSTHITYGVVTGGFVAGDWKIEASAFHGREPDQFRWNFDSFALDSASARLSFNPTPNWALQLSHGFLKSPEQLAPATHQHRSTASASYNLPLGGGNWQTTFAFGRNDGSLPGPALNAFLLETAVSQGPHTLFARAENTDKDELFEAPDSLAGRVFNVSSLSLGYVYDIPVAEHLALGLGAMGTLSLVPRAMQSAYGGSPASTMVFTRLTVK